MQLSDDLRKIRISDLNKIRILTTLRPDWVCWAIIYSTTLKRVFIKWSIIKRHWKRAFRTLTKHRCAKKSHPHPGMEKDLRGCVRITCYTYNTRVHLSGLQNEINIILLRVSLQAMIKKITTESKNYSVDDEMLEPNGEYAAKVRSSPNGVNYKGEWSAWSPEVHWRTQPAMSGEWALK